MSIIEINIKVDNKDNKDIEVNNKDNKVENNSEIEKIKTLVKYGIINLNLRDNNGYTALMRSCISSNNDKQDIKNLIDMGADLNLQRVGWTALMLTIKYSDNISKIEIIEMLIKAGADLNLQDKEGNSALILAIRYEKIEIAEMLIKAGANLQNNKNINVLSLAIKNLNNNSNTKKIEALIEALIKGNIDLDLQDINGNTPLTSAITNSNIKIAKILIKAGANVNLQNDAGLNALMLTIRYLDNISKIEIVEMLIKAGADLNLQDKEGNSALILAISYASRVIVEMLIKAGANMNLKDNKGKTAIMLAMKYEKIVIVEMLIEAGVNVHYINFNTKQIY